MKFKIGDRARILIGHNKGKECVLLEYGIQKIFHRGRCYDGWRVRVDGVGEHWPIGHAQGRKIGYQEQNLQPVINDGELKFFEEIKKFSEKKHVKEPA